MLLPLGVLALGRLATKAEKGTVTLLASSSGFFVVFLAMESLALSSCCLVALPKSFGSLEAALKYFAAGVLGASFALYGVLFYFYLYESAGFFSGPSQARELSTRLGLAAVSLFTLFALFIKLGVAPFHYWVADVYEGSPQS